MSTPQPQPAPAISTTFTWDYREQPPMEAIASRVAQLSGGTLRMEMPETGSDEYELTISRIAPQPAPGLADAMAEVRELRELLADVLGSFSAGSVVGGQTKGDAIACVGRSQLAKWQTRAGLPR